MTTPIIREGEDGTLDEFIASNADIHFEAMSSNQWWIGVTLPDGRVFHINCGARNPRAGAYVLVEQVG